MKKDYKPIIALFGIIVVLTVAWILLQRAPIKPDDGSADNNTPPPPSPKIAQGDLKAAWPKLIANAASPTPMGNPRAKYTLIEIGDFQCPNCGKAEPIVMRLIQNSDGNAKLYFYNYPLPSIHPHALIAAQAGLSAASQDKFWPMYQLLYSTQDSLIDSQIEFNARNIPGLNTQKLTDDLAKGTYLPTLRNQIALVQSVPGIVSVPTLLIREPSGNILVYEGAAPTSPNVTYPGINKAEASPPWAQHVAANPGTSS